ncbi:MAG: hypothetical protein IPL53_20415 [Ignavibacteria bacterium]|nr:hypothetical protein [Ignavibacteria bacterium]
MNLNNTNSNREISGDAESPLLLNVIRSAGREKLRQKLDVIGSSYFKSRSIPVKGKITLKAKLEELFFLYFSPYENLVTVRSSKTKEKSLQEGMSFYTLKKYPEAVKLLKKYLIQYPDDSLIMFYLGISLLTSGKYKNASGMFKKILKSKNSLLFDHAKWYLALSYLKDSKPDKTLNELKSIEKESVYFRKAGNLMKKISLIK